jgi:hypothetical protein
MWSDLILAAERAHLVRLVLWGAACVLVGSALLALLAARRAGSPLIRHFAIQMSAWGLVELAFALVAWRSLAPRDLAAATRLDRFVWFGVGLDLGIVGVGATLALAGWMLGRRASLLGAGVAVMVQGLALGVMDLVLAAQLGAGS